jgi:hypothetical protein
MAERSIDAALKSAAQSAEFGYIVFVALDFPTGYLYVHNGIGTYTFGGNDYLGVGAFGSIDTIEDTTALVSRPVNLTLSSITQEIIDEVKTENLFGRDADIYVGAINSDGELLADPDNWWSGYMENIEISLGEENAVKIRLQSRASRLRLRSNKRYTLEEQQVVDGHDTDLLFEFLPSLKDARVVWGGEQVRTGHENTGGLGNPGSRTEVMRPFGIPVYRYD